MFEKYFDEWLRETPYLDYLQVDLVSVPLERPHYLYRIFNSIDELIYVGETSQPLDRMLQHKRNSEWFPLSTRILFYGCDSKKEALALEEISINRETPIYNIKGKKGLVKQSIKHNQKPTLNYCGYCETLLDPAWARANQKYCDASCQASYWYRKKYKTFYNERYAREKREWTRSPNGKRAGIKLYEWRKLPKDWK